MAVYRMVQFLLDIAETLHSFRFLAQRQMQRFIGAVREERTMPDVLLQRGITQKVRMECQQPTFLGKNLPVIHIDRCSRSQKQQGGIGIVVVFTPIDIVATFTFQQ